MTKHRWVAPLAVGLILLVDRRICTDNIPLPIKAAAGESAHIATTLCLLSLIRPKRPRDFFAGAIVGSVALDVDHLPLYAMYEKPSARPGSHSLVTVALVAGLTARSTGRRRGFLQGVSFGLTSHLLRDLLTGGAPLLWPLSGRRVMIGASGLPSLRSRSRIGAQRTPDRQLRHRVVVPQAVAFPTASTARSFTVNAPWAGETTTLARTLNDAPALTADS